jgi:predicted RNase H-like HicB family nuclease
MRSPTYPALSFAEPGDPDQGDALRWVGKLSQQVHSGFRDRGRLPRGRSRAPPPARRAEVAPVQGHRASRCASFEPNSSREVKTDRRSIALGRRAVGRAEAAARATNPIQRYRVVVSEKLRLTISFESPDEDGWIVAHVVEVPGAISQGRTREEARENVIDALRLMLSPDDGDAPDESVALEVLLPA